MHYISVAEASNRWGLSQRQVQRLLANSRIPGARKYGKSWMIPKNAMKPGDLRGAKYTRRCRLAADLRDVFAASSCPMPSLDPDSILDTLREPRIKLIYECEIAYLRGDFQKVLDRFERIQDDEAVKLRVCLVAIVAAISLGDHRVYDDIDAYLKGHIQAGHCRVASMMAEFGLAIAAVSAVTPEMAPDWLKEGEFGALPMSARLNCLYLRAKYFNCIGKFDVMLAVAQTALSFYKTEEGFVYHDIYMRLMCAVAYRYLGQDEQAKRWLLDAMALALPHGFITPFAELVTALGGLVEECLHEKYPACCDVVVEQWKRTFKNWIAFHNRFAQDNITLILSLRELHIASLAVQHVPYREIAKRYGISLGRLKNIMQEIYQKLQVCSRDELAQFIFP